MSLGDPALTLPCHTTAWVRVRWPRACFHPSPSLEGRRTGPKTMRTGEPTHHLTGCNTQKADAAACLNNTIMLILLVGRLKSSPEAMKVGELAPLLICHEVMWVKEGCLPTFHFSPPATGRRTGPWVMRVEELALHFAVCSTQEQALVNTVKLVLVV